MLCRFTLKDHTVKCLFSMKMKQEMKGDIYSWSEIIKKLFFVINLNEINRVGVYILKQTSDVRIVIYQISQNVTESLFIKIKPFCLSTTLGKAL